MKVIMLKIVASILLIASGQISINQADAFDILPFDKPFTIRGTIRKHPETNINNLAGKTSWVESYTLERQIAKCDYYVNHFDQLNKYDKTLYKDRFGLMVFNKYNRACDIEMDLFNSILLEAMPLNNKTLDSWIVGPSARTLLSFLQETEGQTLTYVGSDESFQVSASYAGKFVKYEVFYKKMDKTGDYRNDLPLRIVIQVISSPKLDKKKLKFSLDLGRPEIVKERENGWDRFAVNPNESMLMGGTNLCYQLRVKRVFNLDIVNVNQFTFRFRTIVDEMQNEVLEGQVEYDGRIGMMQTRTRAAKSRYLEQKLFNFETNRKYYMTKKLDEYIKDDPEIDYYFDDPDSIVIMQTVGGKREDKPDKTYLANLPLGTLLIGNENFVELGLVKYRGIRARAYTLSQRGSMPFWLYQPSALIESGAIEDTKGFNEKLYSTTIYVSESPAIKQSQDPQLDTVPLAIEIKTDKCNYRAELFDFVWSANDPEGVNKFSLGKLMPGPYKQSLGAYPTVMHEYKIDLNMLLLAKAFRDGDLVNSAIDRDIALAAAFQRSLKWPVQYMSDLETRLLHPNLNDKIKYRPMVATLLLAHPNRQLSVDLKYIGMARDFNLNINGNKKIVGVSSLEMCVAIASSRNMIKSVFVGFDWTHQECLICGPKQVGGSTEEAARAAGFAMSPLGYIQLFQARKQIDTDAMEIDKQLNNENRYKLINSYMKVDGLLSVDDDLSGKIKNVQIKYLESERDDDDEEENKSHTVDQFAGIALVEHGQFTWKINPKELNTSDTSWIEPNGKGDDATTYDANVAMSLELCQSIAMSYDHIESYSICMKPGDIRCLVSKFSFRDAEVGKKLLQIKRNATIKAGKFNFKMPDSKIIQLEKHGNCELHNKRYLGAFSWQSSGLVQITKDELLYPIDFTLNTNDANYGPEQCARYCLKHNVNYMRQDSQEIKRAMADPNGISDRWYKDRSGHICQGFLYFETLSTSSNSSRVDGFCNIMGTKLEIYDTSLKPVTLDLEDSIEAKVYSLNSETFFDKIEGKRLMESKMTGEVQSIHNKLVEQNEKKSEANHITDEELNVLKKFIQDGGNFQSFHVYETISQCAQACFSQTQKLWPGCKSFGLLAWASQTRFDCYLNTVTMRETLLKPGPNSPKIINVTYSHATNRRTYQYEPRAGFLIDDLDAFEQATMSANATQINGDSSDGHITALGSFVVMLIVSLGLAIGLVLGVKLTSFVMTRQSSNPFSRLIHDDIENLVPPPASIPIRDDSDELHTP